MTKRWFGTDAAFCF